MVPSALTVSLWPDSCRSDCPRSLHSPRRASRADRQTKAEKQPARLSGCWAPACGSHLEAEKRQCSCAAPKRSRLPENRGAQGRRCPQDLRQPRAAQNPHSFGLGSGRVSRKAVCSEWLAPPGRPPVPAPENPGTRSLQSQINHCSVEVKCIQMLGKSSSPS